MKTFYTQCCVFLLGIAVSTGVCGQNRTVSTPLFICHYYGKKINESDLCNSVMGYGSSRAEREVKKITELMHLSRNPFQMMECPNTDNCYATLVEGVPYIIYDRSFLQRVHTVTQKDWAAISILAHEVGHLVYYHPTSQKGSQHQKELEADEFSGATLYKMGATLEEAQLAMQYFQEEVWTTTHPPRSQRMKAIAKGWLEEKRKEEKNVVAYQNNEVATPNQTISDDDEMVSSTAMTTYPQPEAKKIDSNIEVGKYGCVEGDCINGYGYYIHKSQGSYKGMWKNGIREGIGVQLKADGSKLFEGMYENGKRSGNGIYYFSNNIYLEAVFENDFPTKEGRLINQSGAQPRELNYVQSNGEISAMKIPK